MTVTEHFLGEQVLTTDEEPLIVIASNRGPFSFSQTSDGDMAIKRGSGGLVTALTALAEKHDVRWIAAALSDGDRQWLAEHGNEAVEIEGIRLRLIQPEEHRYHQYYNIISNPLLWFIQHQLWDIPRKPSISRETWQAWREGYVAVNRQFAGAIVESIKDVARPVLVLPQDYHLYLVPRFLREQVGDRVQIQPFIHIPWPGPDAWRILPEEMRKGILEGLLASNRIGFQTVRDAFNFVQCCRFYLSAAHSRGARDAIYHQGREVEARAYPISIDADKLQSIVEEPQTRLLKGQLINALGDHKLILRVDRVEPSKNILRGLEAFRELLERYPAYRGKVRMFAFLVPSRMEVDEYQDYLQQIMALAGMINAEYSDEYWEPIRVWVGENYYRAIAAMQLYDVLLVNPIADGMNLVAKEGVLVNQRDGVLILSEHAGVVYELGEYALTVSPFDIYSTAEAMHQALSMPLKKRGRRAKALRDQVLGADVKMWFYQQLRDALTALSSQDKNASTS